MSKYLSFALVLFFLCVVMAGCAVPVATPLAPTAVAPSPASQATLPSSASSCNLRLATTTSTYDSGLLDAILPDFQTKFNCHVDVVAVGTGQAIEIGSKGDADVLLVHARKQEDQFVKDGHARERFDVMYNDFILVGPRADPAKISGGACAVEAFKQIAATASLFASRGDKSGTNTKELGIWASAGITPTKQMAWYNSLGQGMGETLLTSNEKGMYTLTDRGTWLAMQAKLPNLIIVLGGKTLQDNKDKSLLNPYGVMAVNPDKHPGVQFDMAMNFVHWILAPETQQMIGAYGKDKFGQPLFYPNAVQ